MKNTNTTKENTVDKKEIQNFSKPLDDGKRMKYQHPINKKIEQLGNHIVVDEETFAAYLAPIYEIEKTQPFIRSADYSSTEEMMIALGHLKPRQR